LPLPAYTVWSPITHDQRRRVDSLASRFAWSCCEHVPIRLIKHQILETSQDSCTSARRHVGDDVPDPGARSAANPHAACDAAGTGNGITATPTRARRGKPWTQLRSGLRTTAPVPDPSAAMLAAVPAGGSPADGSCPAAIVVILGGGKGDRLVGSPGVNVSVGWERIPVGSAREASKSTGRSKSEPM
jgi:hypothetical protein